MTTVPQMLTIRQPGEDNGAFAKETAETIVKLLRDGDAAVLVFEQFDTLIETSKVLLHILFADLPYTEVAKFRFDNIRFVYSHPEKGSACAMSLLTVAARFLDIAVDADE